MEKRLFGTIRDEPRESFGAGAEPRRMCPPALMSAINHARGKTWRPRERPAPESVSVVSQALRSMGWMGSSFSAKVIYSPQKVPWYESVEFACDVFQFFL